MEQYKVIAALVSVLATVWCQAALARRRQRRIKQQFGVKLAETTSKTSTSSNADQSSVQEEHSEEFDKKEILCLEDNIYVAIGYGLANCIMLEGDDGIIIIDTLESCEVAAEVLAAFREITDKPVVGIILTHFHADHTNGTAVFTAGSQPGQIEIFAHESLPTYLSQVRTKRRPCFLSQAEPQYRFQNVAGDGREVPHHVQAGGPPVRDGDPAPGAPQRRDRTQPQDRRELHHVLCQFIFPVFDVY